jgi:hypothetical protein
MDKMRNEAEGAGGRVAAICEMAAGRWCTNTLGEGGGEIREGADERRILVPKSGGGADQNSLW